MPPRLPSDGQFGVQQALMYRLSPLGQLQVAPQPSAMPARLPSDGQSGLQHEPS